MSQMQTVRLTAKCSASQHRRLTEIYGLSAELYNAALESWRGTYQWWREHHPDPAEQIPRELHQSKYDLNKQFTEVRRDNPEWNRLSVQVDRGVICRFDRTVRGFYERIACGQSPGFPRFKPRQRWRSIEISDPTPGMLSPPNAPRNQSAVWWRLAVKGVPRLRFRDKGHRLAMALAVGRLVEIRVVRTALRTEVHAVVKHPERELPDYEPANPVGIDKGLSHRLTLSDGSQVAARRPDMAADKRAQRRFGRAKRGSRSRAKKRRQLAKAHRREAERARQADFRLAHRLVSDYDGVAVEDLNVSGLLRSKMFSKKMSEQRWSEFDRILEFKAGKAGIPFVRVDPRYTTTDCSRCGWRGQRLPLNQRVFLCGSCGLAADRDYNAARNIRARAFGPGVGWDLPDAARLNFRCKTPQGAGGRRRTASLVFDNRQPSDISPYVLANAHLPKDEDLAFRAACRRC